MGSQVSLMATNTWTRIHRSNQVRGEPIVLPKNTLLFRNTSDFECSCSIISRWKYSTFKSGKKHNVQGLVVILGSLQGGLRVFEAEDDMLSDEEARIGNCSWKGSGGTPNIRLRVSLGGHEGRINSCSTGLDGNIGATCGNDKKILIWNLRFDKVIHTMKGHTDHIKCCKLSHDGAMLVSGDRSGKLLLWDVQRGIKLGTFGKCKPITEEQAKSMSLAELRALEYERSLIVNHTGSITCCDLDHQQPCERALSGSWDTTLLLWDITKQRSIMQFHGHSDRITACSFTPNPNLIVSSSLDQTVLLWDLRTGGKVAALEGHEAEVTSCATSSSAFLSPLVVSGSADGVLKLWDLRKLRERETLVGHSDAIASCSMLENGERVCSVGRDGFVRLWRTRNMLDIPLSFFVGQRGEEVEQVEHLRVDEADEVYCAKEQFRVLSLRRAAGAFVVGDEAYRDVEPGRQKWTCKVGGRKKVLDAFKDRRTLRELGVVDGTPVRLHPPGDREEYLRSLEPALRDRPEIRAHPELMAAPPPP